MTTNTSSAPVGPGSGVPRRRPRSRWIHRAVVFAGCVVLVNALVGDRGLAGTVHARQALLRASEDLAKLKQENAGLREQARRLHEDPSAIEALAREELGLIKPDEILIVLKDLK